MVPQYNPRFDRPQQGDGSTAIRLGPLGSIVCTLLQGRAKPKRHREESDGKSPPSPPSTLNSAFIHCVKVGLCIDTPCHQHIRQTSCQTNTTTARPFELGAVPSITDPDSIHTTHLFFCRLSQLGPRVPLLASTCRSAHTPSLAERNSASTCLGILRLPLQSLSLHTSRPSLQPLGRQTNICHLPNSDKHQATVAHSNHYACRCHFSVFPYTALCHSPAPPPRDTP